MRIIKYYLLLIVILFAGCSKDSIVDTVEPGNNSQADISDKVKSIVQSVNIDSVQQTMSVITGIKPFILNYDTMFIKTRHADYKDNDKAADYIEMRLKSYGFDVVNQRYSETGRNVYGILKGSERPDEYYIICAHYDSMPETVFAPGADDNGSGTTAVIEAARVFSEWRPKSSIIFALWDEEEIGLVGSHFFAADAREKYMNIEAVFNIDMIGWDSNDDFYVNIAVENPQLEYMPVIKAREINTGMDLGLNIGIIKAAFAASDHLSFMANGFNGFCFIEDKQDFNGFYHTTNDQMLFINFNYYEKNCRLILGTLAAMTL